jgi:hypothetical protein
MTATATSPYADAVMPEGSPVLQNPAVAYCCQVWEATHLQSLKAGRKPTFARVDAHRAYQQALPPLIGLENIQNFIACVAHGMLMGSILHRHGTTLLYAAQVAKSTANSAGTQPKTPAE